jgi:hypothetical protein
LRWAIVVASAGAARPTRNVNGNVGRCAVPRRWMRRFGATVRVAAGVAGRS